MEDRLVKLVKLVDAGSFTQAAQELHISQPALTAAIRKLERELQSTLLVRSRQGLALTPSGKIAYRSGRALLAQARNLKLELAELSTQKLPLALGMIDSIAEALLVHSQELRRLEEWAQVSLTINNSSLLIQNVLQHKLDLAIVANATILPAGLTAQPLGIEPLVVVTRADQLPRAVAHIRAGRLPDFLSYNQNSNTHRLLEQTARERGVELQPSFYSTSPEVILQLVLAGRGVAALPYLKITNYLAAGTLQPLVLGKSCLIERHITSVHYATQHTPERLVATLERCKQLLDDNLRAAQRL